VVPALPVADLTRPELSRREAEIAQLAARGLSNREIAERLFVSVRTVEGHLHRLYAKLGVSDRSELSPFVAMPAEPENA
jgi:DNA-binding NarL/FixJ family response regulator